MYASVADLRNSLDEKALLTLVDDEGEGTTATGELRTKQAARVTKSLGDASAEADAYIGQRYDLPLPSTPPVLRGKVVDIAVWNLFARRGLGDADEVVRERYKNAVKWLEQLAVGKVSLPLPVSGGGDDGSGGSTPQSGGASIRSQPRVFDRDKLRGF